MIGDNVKKFRKKKGLTYDPKFVAKGKSIEGYRWHPDKKYWSFPYSQEILRKIISVFKGESIDLDSTLQISFNLIK